MDFDTSILNREYEYYERRPHGVFIINVMSTAILYRKWLMVSEI
jgi:hypothetical protein